jgi:glycosyltransferase involved in cell wall biosynthesis
MPVIPIHTNINVMPPDTKKKLLPYTVIRILTGGEAIPNFENKPDVIGLKWNDDVELLHRDDFKIAKSVADSLWQTQVVAKNLLTTISSLPTAMGLHKSAMEEIERIVDDKYQGKKGLLFIKDKSGCGYWRMVVPARYLDDSEIYIDCAEVEVTYDYLLEYGTIVVQRLHSWKEYYVLRELKKLGKYLVYDIDDDIFNIPPSNPVYRYIRADQQEAAKAIMELADVITTPSEVIKERFGFQNKTIVIPNAIDLDDGWVKLIGNDVADTQALGSPDENRRILWAGSATHGQDWVQCVGAVDEVMRQNDDVRLVVLGFLPDILRSFIEDANRPWWNKRVEFMDFVDVETYCKIAKHIRADVAIAPLEDTLFNQAKSCLKFVEYTAIGAPCVASNVTPYKEVIEHGKSGFLADEMDEWIEHMQYVLDHPKDRMSVVREARKTVTESYNIKRVIENWKKVFRLS